MVKLTRAQIRPGVKGVDVTVKSAKGYAGVFSPTWPMVMGYKNGTLTEAQYTEQYMKILGAVSVEAWRWLYAQAVNGEVVLLCYCRDVGRPGTTSILSHPPHHSIRCGEVSEGVQQRSVLTPNLGQCSKTTIRTRKGSRMTKKHRTYSPEFKAHAVLAVISGSKTAAELCREQQIKPDLLSKWKRRFSTTRQKSSSATTGLIHSRPHRRVGAAGGPVDTGTGGGKKASTLLRPAAHNDDR